MKFIVNLWFPKCKIQNEKNELPNVRWCNDFNLSFFALLMKSCYLRCFAAPPWLLDPSHPNAASFVNGMTARTSDLNQLEKDLINITTSGRGQGIVSRANDACPQLFDVVHKTAFLQAEDYNSKVSRFYLERRCFLCDCRYNIWFRLEV